MRNTRFGVSSPETEESEDGEYLLRWFWDISSRRLSGMGGPEPLGPGLIRDWSLLNAVPISQDEISVLLKLDSAFLNSYYADAKERRDKEEEERKRKAQEDKEAKQGYSEGPPG